MDREEGEFIVLDVAPSGEQQAQDLDVDMSISGDEQEYRDEISNPDLGANFVDAGAEVAPQKRKCAVSSDGPFVEVSYKGLTRESRIKLEEVLSMWSRWQAAEERSSQDELEDGKETFFPALKIPTSGSSFKMHFWVDRPSKRARVEEEIPLYDRGFDTVLQVQQDGEAGTLELPEEASRCFNCGSYSHALKDCTRTRDFAAISSARKQFLLRRGPATPASRRYYENAPAGKFDDIRPGILGTEARKSLGIGENDPPPWLDRMREIGYPPGYLGFDENEAEPSGIDIFNESVTATAEEGEIVEAEPVPEKQPTRMTVEFPGVNAPIPASADERLWLEAETSKRSHSRGSRSELHSSLSDSGGRVTSRLAHPGDSLSPPGTSSRNSSWILAQAALAAAARSTSSGRRP